MILRDKIIFWILSIAALFWFLGAISSILIPFISAVIIAYFLDPLADQLEKFKLPRSVAVLIILSIFIAIITLIAILVIPALYSEFLGLVEAIPRYSNRFLEETYPKINAFLKANGYELDTSFKSYLSEDNIKNLFSFSNNLVGGITNSSIAVINILSLLFITPILAFYLIKDWNKLVGNIDKYLPSKHAFKIRRVFLRIDRALSGYVRGQFNVCLILGAIYAIGLSIVGLNFGFFIGFLTGIMAFVPYVGMITGGLIAVIVGLFQWGLDSSHIGLVLIVLLVGQVVESNFLTPRLVGSKIGLHPVWVIFAIFAFGALFGFIGVLLAVPMAAIVGVIVRFVGDEYRKVFVKKT